MSINHAFFLSVIPGWLLASWWASRLQRWWPTGEPERAHNLGSLESLRGLAAYLVLCAHVTMYFGALAKEFTASSFTGGFGVEIFFMLTGYLFWSQIADGRFKVDRFAERRVRRLVPLCLFVVAVVMAVDWVRSGFVLPSWAQLEALVRNFAFGFGGVHDVFAPETVLRINTIWSLKWEWLFYFALPYLALTRSFWVVAVASALLAVVFFDVRPLFHGGESEAAFILAFLAGASGHPIAKWVSRQAKAEAIKSVLTVLALCVFAALFAWWFLGEAPVEPKIRKASFVFLGWSFFLPFVLSPKWLAWLCEKVKAEPLGKISYSLYLWQLVVTFFVVRGLEKVTALQSLPMYVAVLVGLTLVLVAISHASYRAIELRFMHPASPARDAAR